MIVRREISPRGEREMREVQYVIGLRSEGSGATETCKREVRHITEEIETCNWVGAVRHLTERRRKKRPNQRQSQRRSRSPGPSAHGEHCCRLGQCHQCGQCGRPGPCRQPGPLAARACGEHCCRCDGSVHCRPRSFYGARRFPIRRALHCCRRAAESALHPTAPSHNHDWVSQ